MNGGEREVRLGGVMVGPGTTVGLDQSVKSQVLPSNLLPVSLVSRRHPEI